MKRWWIPTVAILGFFILLTTMFKTIGTSSTNSDNAPSKVDSAMNNVANPIDATKIQVANKIATHGEMAPKWGSLTKSIPKLESFSFKGTNAKANDTKVAKKDKKKKKKSAQKKKKPKTVVKVIKSKADEAAAAADTGISDSNYGDVGPFTPAKKEKDPNALPETFEEWESYLLNPPSMNALMNFIKFHNARIVSDEIFYQLSAKMLGSRSSQVRKFAIIALGSSPSVESFILLTAAYETESSAELQGMISSNYHTYYGLQYVSVLGSAMLSSNQNARYYAIVSLAQSASINIRRTGDVNGGRGRTGANNNSQRYEGLLGVLQNLSSNDPVSAVRTEAQRTLEIIRTLTETTSVVAAN